MVSFETAKALRVAGFPQPSVQIGQVWYNNLKCMSVVVKYYGNDFSDGKHFGGCSLVDGSSGNDFSEADIRSACFFAPTATDILRELPNKILFWKYENIFVCGVQVVGDNDYYTIQFETVYKHENPAEACALAWLEKNKK